jgi:ATP-dependent DNA ligase
MTLYKRLYKLNTDKSTQVWEVHYDDKSYWSVSGKLDGKMVESGKTIVTPKGNRTMKEQIMLEMDSKVKKKGQRRYVENVDNIKKADGDLPGFAPMLAQGYNKHSHKIDQLCSVQRKLDGIRNCADATGFYSRKRHPISTCQHIRDALAPFFKKYPEARLDGEFYTHAYKEDFEKICRAVKKENPDEESLAMQKKVEYHVYDAPRIGKLNEDDSFKDRHDLLKKLLAGVKHVKVVETKHGVKEADIVTLKEKFIQEGYEGAMIRNTHSPYEYAKRSYNLQKLKDFDDAEFEIVSANEGNGSLKGCVGSFTVKMKDGKTFDAKLDGTNNGDTDMKNHDHLKHLWENPEEWKGKMATIRYQGLTKYGIPRFPVMKCIRSD